MRRVRFAHSNGNAQFTVPGGSEITYLRIIPGFNDELQLWGTWMSINESSPHFLVCPIEIRAADFGAFPGHDGCDMFPGTDGQMTITIGTGAAPRSPLLVINDVNVGAGAAPQDVFIIYQGGP